MRSRFHVAPPGKIREPPNQVLHSPVLGKPARKLMRRFHVVGHFSAIEIHRQRHVTLGGIAGCLLLDPVVQSPPLMHHNQPRVRPRRLGQIQNPLRHALAAGEGDSLLGEAICRHYRK